MLPGLDLALCYDCANAASEMLHDMTGVMEKDPPGGLAAVADLRRCIGKLEEHGLISKHGARAMVAFAESLALTAVSEDVTVD